MQDLNIQGVENKIQLLRIVLQKENLLKFKTFSFVYSLKHHNNVLRDIGRNLPKIFEEKDISELSAEEIDGWGGADADIFAPQKID